RYRRVIPSFSIKEMKIALALNITVLFMLTVKLGESITCIKCGLGNASCEREAFTIDCSSDSEFGEHYDSCFSMTAYDDNKRTQIKDCAFHSACDELEQALCKHFKTAGNSTDAMNCRVDCCRGDLCNDGKVRFAAMISASGGYDTIIFWIFATVAFFSIEFGIILPR
ncbi:unnamed protein product, partial [Porites lobata]